MNYKSDPIFIPQKKKTILDLEDKQYLNYSYSNFDCKTPEYGTPSKNIENFFERKETNSNMSVPLYSNNITDPNPYEPSPTNNYKFLFQKIYMDLYANISLSTSWNKSLKNSIMESKNEIE
tara:strand:+ start:1009 stop:1371 length:363 start_codon:yes stop_codon:yes gene_type:complete